MNLVPTIRLITSTPRKAQMTCHLCTMRQRQAASTQKRSYGQPQQAVTECLLGRCSVGLGYDEGTVLIKIGREEPVASMDASGKIIWARHNEIQTVNVKSLGADFEEVSSSMTRSLFIHGCKD